MKKFRSKKAMQAVLALVLGMSVVMPVEATTYDIPSSSYPSGKEIPNVESGDVMNINGNAEGKITNMSGGTQNIRDNAIGKITNMTSGWQYIAFGSSASPGQTTGKGYVDKLTGGIQIICAGAYGSIDYASKNGDVQDIRTNGNGHIDALEKGKQKICFADGYSGGKGSINTMNDGAQYVSNQSYATIDTMNAGLQQVSVGSTGIINTMNGGYQDIYSGSTGIIDNLNSGFQRIRTGTTGTVKSLNGGRIYVRGTSKDTVINGGNMLLDGVDAKIENLSINSGNLYLRYKNIERTDFALDGDFKLAGGVVDMTNEASYANGKVNITFKDSYETLTINNFTQGGGTFLMNTDLASQTDSDKIIIQNANANETTYIEVKDKSKTEDSQVTGKKKLLLVTVNNGTANFAGKNINEGGLWQETPTIERGDMVNGEDGNTIGAANEWYLTNFVRAINEDTKVLLHRADNSYALWRNTSDSLRQRLGELRPASGNGDGVWAKYLGGKFDGLGYEGNFNMYQLGYDKAADAKSTYGFALEKGSGKASYELGSGKDELVVGSLYGVWTADDGSYTDVVARVGQFDSDVKSYGRFPDKADYKTKAYSLSAEYGKKISLSQNAGTYIEAQAQFILGRLASTSYTSDRGNNVQLGGTNAYIGRLGFVLGQKTAAGHDIYLKASALHEFGGDRDVRMVAANKEELALHKDYSDTWFELGLGANIKLSENALLYGDVERSFGADIEKKWQVNAGLRWSF